MLDRSFLSTVTCFSFLRSVFPRSVFPRSFVPWLYQLPLSCSLCHLSLIHSFTTDSHHRQIHTPLQQCIPVVTQHAIDRMSRDLHLKSSFLHSSTILFFLLQTWVFACDRMQFPFFFSGHYTFLIPSCISGKFFFPSLHLPPRLSHAIPTRCPPMRFRHILFIVDKTIIVDNDEHKKKG